MTGRIENITISRMLELCREATEDELEELVSAARTSDPLIAGFDGDELLCIVGFNPGSLLSDEAYVWMCSTHAVAKHRIVFGRWVKRMIEVAWHRYPRLIGHCEGRFVGWLRHLGAQFGPVENGLVSFIIEKSNV